MHIEPPAKLLLIYLDETDTWGEERVPLYEAISRALNSAGIAGATVSTGIMGFGANHRLHRKRLFGVTDERPVIIQVVDNEAKLRAVFPKIRSMVREGLIFLVDGEIVHQGLSVPAEGSSAE